MEGTSACSCEKRQVKAVVLLQILRPLMWIYSGFNEKIHTYLQSVKEIIPGVNKFLKSYINAVVMLL